MVRTCDLSILSDCHLGTAHCRDAALLEYLDSVRPDRLIINGDLCDLGPYLTRHWPLRHQAVVRRLLELRDHGCEIIYVVGNHDAILNSIADLLPGLQCCAEYRCSYHGRRWLFTHGHRFDGEFCSSRLVRQLGGLGYDLLQGCETGLNRCLQGLGLPTSDLVRTCKRWVPGVSAALRRFEAAAIAHAAEVGVDGICCGHIHLPRAIDHQVGDRTITYLNCGDWVEHCTVVEADGGRFALAEHALPQANTLPPRSLPLSENRIINAA